MNRGKLETPKRGIALEYEFCEPPQKVWRAISMAEFRDIWLPGDALAEPEATAVIPGEQVSYRMRDDEPPFLESTVTFKISPTENGGTRLRIIHDLTDTRFARATQAANTNEPTALLAA